MNTQAAGPTQRNVDEHRAPRLMVVGIADADADHSALAWTLADARPGIDSVHVVHAYSPIRLDGCSWAPVVAARDARRSRGTRVIAAAEQRLRSQARSLQVDGSLVAGISWDVLGEFSLIVDLLVVGEDDAGAELATTASRVARLAQCPVITVPADWVNADRDADAPVTVLLDGGAASAAVVGYGFAEAHRWGAGLQLVTIHTGPADAWAGWADRYPGVHVVHSTFAENDPLLVPRLRRTSRLLVTGRNCVHRFDQAAPLPAGRCAVVTVPN